VRRLDVGESFVDEGLVLAVLERAARQRERPRRLPARFATR
jgi:hypothetical protein